MAGLAVSLAGCCKSQQEDAPGTNEAGDTCEFLLDDDFSRSLDAHWQRGTNAKKNPAGPTVRAEQGSLVFSQHYDYIETKESVSGDFDVEVFGIARSAGSNQCADLYIELVAAPDEAGIFRFSYGTDKKESINIGKGPRGDQVRGWSCIRDAPHLKELDARGESKGRLRLEHKNRRVRLSYTDSASRTISTPWVSVPDFEATKLRIWGLGGKGSKRSVDRIKICSKGSK